ncbi:Hypothetical protein SRAE_1000113900 [Strongyloides ratti]|uniref:Uncharacterized protein n=1 Tax=Strongyloides ratti TaxID=34506 RepID=A0A090L432_STRRB|nr:Hypothetical protein SRAE_1000113900 [Strongyloides ratti]CEF62872.1 Hypothetical protein SRAE_1000113900 [Strongyloides ratti]
MVMLNEEEYWIIKSVCTFREFDEPSPPNFDGEKFFKKLRKEMAEENNENLIIFNEFPSSYDEILGEKNSQNKNNKIIPPPIASENTSKVISELKDNLNTSSKILPSLIKKQTNTIKCSSSEYSNTSSKKVVLPSSLYKIPSALNVRQQKLIDMTTSITNNFCKNTFPINNQNVNTTTNINGRILNPSLRRSYSFDRSVNRYPSFIQLDNHNKAVKMNPIKATKPFLNNESDLSRHKRFQMKRSASIGPDLKPSFLGSKIRSTNFIKSTANVVTEIKNTYKISNDRIRNVVERLTRQKGQPKTNT